MARPVNPLKLEAIEKGLIKYSTGVPCKRGHLAERFISDGSCTICAYERTRLYQENNRERKAVYQETYRQRNLSKMAAKEAKRRFMKNGATPLWLSPKQLLEIEEIYEFARSKGYHVDHIVPLKHDKVCGLHVPWNLQTLEPKENIMKSNNFEVNQ